MTTTDKTPDKELPELPEGQWWEVSKRDRAYHIFGGAYANAESVRVAIMAMSPRDIEEEVEVAGELIAEEPGRWPWSKPVKVTRTVTHKEKRKTGTEDVPTVVDSADVWVEVEGHSYGGYYLAPEQLTAEHILATANKLIENRRRRAEAEKVAREAESLLGKYPPLRLPA